MSTQVLPERIAVPAAPEYGRRRPLFSLGLAVAFLGLHHAWIVWNGSTATSLLMLSVLIMPALAAVSIAGLIYPPIFYTMSNAGKRLPLMLKILAGIIALAGAAGGVYMGQLLYHFL